MKFIRPRSSNAALYGYFPTFSRIFPTFSHLPRVITSEMANTCRPSGAWLVSSAEGLGGSGWITVLPTFSRTILAGQQCDRMNAMSFTNQPSQARDTN